MASVTMKTTIVDVSGTVVIVVVGLLYAQVMKNVTVLTQAKLRCWMLIFHNCKYKITLQSIRKCLLSFFLFLFFLLSLFWLFFQISFRLLFQLYCFNQRSDYLKMFQNQSANYIIQGRIQDHGCISNQLWEYNTITYQYIININNKCK